MDTLLTEIMIFLRNCGKIAYQEGRSCSFEDITSRFWSALTRSNRAITSEQYLLLKPMLSRL
jgi:hypothetical protein